MDVFRFIYPSGSSPAFQSGPILNNIKSKTWIERYREAGEFTFVANTNSGLMEALPIGSLVTHVDTPELMVVENHEIVEGSDGPSEITVTGRSFETILEQRTPHAAQFWHFVPPDHYTSDFSVVQEPLTIDADYSWEQAYQLMTRSFFAPGDAIPYLETLVHNISHPGTSEERDVPLEQSYSSILKFLEIDNCGIKTLRPGTWSFGGGFSSDRTTIVIHDGELKTASTTFSYDSGDLENAEYLESNKPDKNAALVQGKWLRIYLVPNLPTGAARRTITIDATDIDGHMTNNPTGDIRERLIGLMVQKGYKALAATKPIELTKAEVKQANYSSQYREQFDVGDLVNVRGTYKRQQLMRITEFAEIEDQNGRSGHPTLALPWI